jgi:hypothetical protein
MPIESKSQGVERDALYYPYIHIRSIDWLKRTLLVFPHVARIIPRNPYVPDDVEEIRKFERTLGRWGVPLLRSADLRSNGVQQAQLTLLELLSDDLEHVPNFLAKYGRRSLHNSTLRREFLLHEDKPIYPLVRFLRENGLMWKARDATSSAFTAVHPAIGEAIMSTIAMACARDEGFDVVTDEGRVHRNIRDDDVAALYRTLTEDKSARMSTRKAEPARLCELLVFQQCDVSKLTPAHLAALSNDYEAISAFRSALARIADKIPDMENTKAFDDRLRFAVNEALSAWQQDRMNMSKVSKEVFGKELLKPTGDFVKSLVEKFAAPVAGVATGAVEGGLEGAVLGAAGGFIVMLVVHAVSSWIKAKENESNSPYRYLTQVEDAGVAFTFTR